MKIRTEMIGNNFPEGLSLQQESLEKIKKLLPNSQIEAVGAMAVPMIGRPEIDLMVISKNVAEDSQVLVVNGYKQGPVVDGISFLKIMVAGIEVAIQVIPVGHKMIDTHRNIIALLQKDGELRKRYEEFKSTLSGLSREEYKRKKSEWVKENIRPLLGQG